MIPPKGIKIYEFPASIFWFDENGIMCSIANDVTQTVEQAMEVMEKIRGILNGRKVCLLSDNTNAAPVNKAMRDYAAEVIPEIAKAIAVISRSSVGTMAANLFFKLKKQPYPVKFFNDEKEAKEWLKLYL